MTADRPPKRDQRAERLARALRANLRRRKDQARGRLDGEAPDGPSPDGPSPPDDQQQAPRSRHKDLEK